MQLEQRRTRFSRALSAVLDSHLSTLFEGPLVSTNFEHDGPSFVIYRTTPRTPPPTPLQEEVRISKGGGAAAEGQGQPIPGEGAAAGAAAGELDEVAPEPLDMSFPRQGVRKQCTYLLLFPIIFPLWLTLPDTRRKSCKSPGKLRISFSFGRAARAAQARAAATRRTATARSTLPPLAAAAARMTRPR